MTLAFMLVALTTAGLVSLFIRFTNVNRLAQFVIDQQRSNLSSYLVEYYSANNSWDGIADQWQGIRLESQPTYVSTPAAPDSQHYPDINPAPPENRQNNYGLADANGKIIVPVGGNTLVGMDTPADLLKSGIAVEVDGQRVGTILEPNWKPHFNPQEAQFLERTNEALFHGMLVATLVALIMGIFLARTLIRPIQALTCAAQKIAQGQLEQEVKVTSRDEIGQLALAFNTMSHEVARSNQMRRQMTMDIAHDLRTPLTVIAGYIESMRDGILQPTTSRLALIYSEIEHLQNLVSDLRMLSQADAGELPLNPQPIAPRTLLEHAAAPFGHRAEQQNVRLEVDAAETLPEIRVDEARMIQVFGNLISNALRYTSDGGIISLSARADNGNVFLTVHDTGTGIPEQELSRIFDRFYRVDQSRSETGETGLGLAIAKAMVEAHGGTITVDSTCGQYTAFHITFKQA
jgi:signal transduction histidine kinase